MSLKPCPRTALKIGQGRSLAGKGELLMRESWEAAVSCGNDFDER